ncbi:Rab3 GTPase-activating protein non-catalytic subunit [Nymphon striatum]|nr:Rab3 GTPase-activating protein non-catalytic subunit [Nymphon striatum]
MSCEILSLATISDIKAIKKFFFPYSKEEASDDWELKWEWTDVDQKNDSNEDNNLDNWMQECLISVSPVGDTIALAHENKVVLLTAKWDNEEKGKVKNKFNITWKETLNSDSYEYITSILCLPLVSQKRSSHGGLDWTCIIIGFNTGNVRMYAETGAVLVSQLFHDQPIIKLKCQTFTPSKNIDMPQLSDELMILYTTVVVTIDGFSLFQMLRACRSQVARAAASGSDAIVSPPLGYKKWALDDPEKIIDFDSIGTVYTNQFDHVQNASLIRGFHGSPDLSVTSTSLFITVGINPYISFFHASENAPSFMMSDIAVAVASNLKNVLVNAASGIFGFATKAAPEDVKSKPKIEPAKKLPIRLCIPDHRRGDSIIISPSRNLCAVTDSYGRIVLVDINKGVAVRIWKGYRDAQCAWLESEDEINVPDIKKPLKLPRKALFLIVYAPRRGIVEVWLTQNGPRVAAFNVDKSSRLQYAGYNMMGLNRQSENTYIQPTYRCCFLQPDGSIKTFVIPFHLALRHSCAQYGDTVWSAGMETPVKTLKINCSEFELIAVKKLICILFIYSDKTSEKAKDIHLLKKIKTILKESSLEDKNFSSSIFEIFNEMKTPGMQQQALNKLMSSSKTTLEILENVITTIMDDFSSQNEVEDTLKLKLLVQNCKRIKQLIFLYKTCDHVVTAHLENNNSQPSCMDLIQWLNLTEEQASRVEQVLEIHKKVIASNEIEITQLSSTLTLTKFLSFFNLNSDHLEHNISEESILPVELCSGEDHHLELVAAHLFSHLINCSEPHLELEDAFSKSGISSLKLQMLLLKYWLNDHNLWKNWPFVRNLLAVVKYLYKIPVHRDSNENFAKSMRTVPDTLTSSENIAAAYTSSLAFRSVVCKNVHIESENRNFWDKLVNSLEDVLVLSSFLKFQLVKSGHQILVNIPLSLKILLEKGRGSISELVAKYLVKNELNADTIWNLSHLKTPEECGIDENQIEFFLDLFKQTQFRFPNSLDYDELMTNVCWENAVQWNKDLDSVSNLNAITEALMSIASSVLRHGVAVMLWKMFANKRFASTAKLFHQMGKPPKERICRKHLGFSDFILETFMEFCSDILLIMLEVEKQTDIESMPMTGVDRLWSYKPQGPASLVELVTAEKQTNTRLVDRHYQLALAMHMITYFSIIKIKPLSLFSIEINNIFFKELDIRVTVPEDNIDLVSAKQNVCYSSVFLETVINAVVRTILESGIQQDSDIKFSMPSPSFKEKSLALNWMRKVYELSEIWNIEKDQLRAQYISELYSSGLDKLGEEVIKSLTDCEIVQSRLMAILGMRLNFVMQTSYSHKKEALLTPQLTTWIEDSDVSPLRCKNPPTEAIYNLLVKIISISSESSLEYRRCMDLHQVFQSLFED